MSIASRTLAFALAASASMSVAHAADPAPAQTSDHRKDELGRIVEVAGRKATKCPKQTDRTAVLLIAGQSNSANHGGMRFTSRHPGKAINYFSGKCYPAASPLLGATGMRGDSWTPLADRLIESRLYDRVVIVTTGIGGTKIARWQDGGDLNHMLLGVVKQVSGRYHITHFLWHQGERDLALKTSGADYAASFTSLVASLRGAKVDAPVFISVGSRCGQPGDWKDEDAITTAQRGLVDPAKGIFLGPETNLLVPPEDRYDRCHFDGPGQRAFAGAWLRILTDYARRAR
ncbi:sialate O-acetylesterase [Sphingopyxis panaciterrae]